VLTARRGDSRGFREFKGCSSARRDALARAREPGEPRRDEDRARATDGTRPRTATYARSRAVRASPSFNPAGDDFATRAGVAPRPGLGCERCGEIRSGFLTPPRRVASSQLRGDRHRAGLESPASPIGRKVSRLRLRPVGRRFRLPPPAFSARRCDRVSALRSLPTASHDARSLVFARYA